MNTDQILSTSRTAIISLSIAMAFAGCKAKPAAQTDDASLNMQVQSRLFSDQNLSGQPIQAIVANGVVTLNGTVTSDTARTIASGDVAQIPGIKTVVNNLAVQPQGSPAAQTSAQSTAPPPPMPMPAGRPYKPSASSPQPQYRQPEPAPIVRNNQAPQQPTYQPSQPQAPPPPPAPVAHNINLPAGTAIPVRITQTLDSATTQTGEKFTGAIASDIIVDGMVVLAQGTPVTGHVEAAQDAAHFKGSSLITISLSTIDRHGDHIPVATDAFSKQGEGRGKNTAEKVGGGAAVGAILGGIFGGGKGAAVGAAAGGGVGAGANTITRGQQVQIPSESVVRFRLSDPITVRVGSNSSRDSNLERRNDQ